MELWKTLACLSLLFAKSSDGQGSKISIGAIFSHDDLYALRSLQRSFAFSNYELLVEKVNKSDPYQVLQAGSRLLQSNVLSLIVSTTSAGFSALPSLSQGTKVPLVSLSKPINFLFPGTGEANKELLIYVEPDTSRTVLDVMRFYKWTNVFYLYDQDGAPEKLQHLLQEGLRRAKVLGIYRMHEGEGVTGVLRKLESDHPGEVIHVLLDMDPGTASDLLLTLARIPAINEQNYHFIIMDSIDHTFWDKNQQELKKLNVSGFQIYRPDSEMVQGVLQPLRIDQSNNEDARTRALLAKDTFRVVDAGLVSFLRSQPELLDSQVKYYVNASSIFQFGLAIKRAITESNAGEGVTGILRFDREGRRTGFTIKVIESTPEGSQEAFSWSDPKGLNSISPAYPTEGLGKKLSANHTLIVTSMLSEPYLMLHENEKHLTGNDRFRGYCKELLDLIASRLQFHYQIKLSSDGSYGKLENGKWKGMIGEVIRHEVDMAISDITRTSAREEVVDFSFPFQTVGISLMIKKPGSEGMESGPGSTAYFFLHVFTLEVWACIFVAFLGVGVLYYFVVRLTGYTLDQRTGTKRGVSILSSLWYSFGSLLLHNVGIYPKSLSSRFLTAIWWLFVVFVSALYLGGLVTMLLVHAIGSGSLASNRALASKTAYSIIEESLRTGVPAIGLVGSGSTRQFFKNSKFTTYLRFNEYLKKHPEVMASSTKEGAQRVKEGNGQYAFLLESSTNEYLNSQEPCDTAMVPQLLDSKTYGIVLPKGSPYRADINAALIALMEDGQLQMLYNSYWNKEGLCQTKKNQRSYADLYHSSITLQDIGGLFYCLVTGVLTTLVVTAVEYCARKRRKGHLSVALTQITKDDHGDLNMEELGSF